MALMMNGDGAATNGGDDATNGGDDTKTPAETLADARDALTELPADATDEAEEMAQELVDEALRLPGNEAELIASLDAKVEQAEERQSVLDVTEQERQTNADELQNAETALASAAAEDKEAAQAAVDEALQMPGNEAALIASLEQQITDQEQTVADAAAKERLAESIARELAIQTAISTTGRVEDMPKLTPTGITSVTAARNPAGMVTVKVSGDDDYTGGETTAGAGDWNGATLTNGTKTLVVYTDIEAPADKLLTVHYSRLHLDNALTFTTDDATDKREGKAQSNGFPSEPGTTWMYTGEVEDGGRAKTLAGTFDGVPGHFSCQVDDANCTLMTDADGKLMTTDQAWQFTPMAPLTATVKDPDAAYAYFGWWLDKPEDNMMPHMVEVFAGGTEDHAAGVAVLIEGNATYKGPAAGKYTTKTFTAGVQTDAGVGHFTASTTLTAKFLDELEEGTIGGTVTGFVLDDGTSPAWSVKLEDAGLTANQPLFDGVSEATFGPTAKVLGTWQGSFYDDADAMDATAPGTVAGTFDAESVNATLIGGFGATKQ